MSRRKKLKNLFIRLWTGDDYALSLAQGGDHIEIEQCTSQFVKQVVKQATEQRERSIVVVKQIKDTLDGDLKWMVKQQERFD